MILPILTAPDNKPPLDALEGRIDAARRMLAHCEMCEWRCGIDRTREEPAPCRLGEATYVFEQYVSVTEEREVVPALRVYLAGCNFRCRFCDTAPDCFDPTRGRRLDPAAFSDEAAAARRRGVRSISLLGGEPTLHVHTLLEIAAAADKPLPLVINTNLYMTPQVLTLLDGVVAMYLADLKFGNDACAQRIAGMPRYLETARRNLRLIHGRTPLIVRHLLMPGHLDCCFRPTVDWLDEQLPGARFELYTGYVPCWKAAQDPSLGRLNRRDEQREAVARMEKSGLRWRAGAAGGQCRVA